MLNRRSLLVSMLLATLWSAGAQSVVQDGFESGTFASGWGLTTGVGLTNLGGANGTTQYAVMAPFSAGSGRELGARFDAVQLSGANDFVVEFSFRIRSTTNRQFHLHVSTSGGSISSSSPALSLRYQGGWAAYDGATWQGLAGLGSVDTNAWYRARVTGRDWGLPGARYDVAVSASGGTNFVNSVTNLTWYQGGTPTSNAARFFVFTSVFGSNPGFDVDEVAATVTAAPVVSSNVVVNIRGTYPHLAVFSTYGEIGMGAIMPWADRLWWVTYPPHEPNGSTDKLWMVDTNLTLTAHPSSVGCTDANRLIHTESGQLNIGHYFIGPTGAVRVISPATMPGRLTASARHLTDPTNRMYIATMEEGLYEVDVTTLAVTQLYEDINAGGPAGAKMNLPGQHGKGLYTSQGRVLYSNNGVGGSLSSWDGTNWTVVESNKFTEITGPGGVAGNDPLDDRLWAMGWDTQSVVLRLLQNGVWTRYRLPKGSYTHDSDTGWYTEWPRIREVTNGVMLMHMHGLFYHFPKPFAVNQTGGLEPICTYLKMPVDYCWWNGGLVMGRDDASTTGGNIWAGQSHSAPWFGQVSDLEQWGPPAGFGGVWVNNTVTAGVASEAFLVKGFQRRLLHLRHTGASEVQVKVQQDPTGAGVWSDVAVLTVPAAGYAWHLFPADLDAAWFRLVPMQSSTGVTAYFHLSNPPRAAVPGMFAGIADVTQTNAVSEGIIRPANGDARTLQFAATTVASNGAVATGYYEIDGALQLRRRTNATAENTLRTTYALTNAGLSFDAASVLYVSGTNRFRLPRSAAGYDSAFASGQPRGVREVVTERQMIQAHGTFYELPLSTSGGFRRIRPITTHGKRISDYASWRGMFAVTGVPAGAVTNAQLYRSDDGQAAVWFGDVDDLWRMGAPSGTGGPWNATNVVAGVASDPYLMLGYDRRTLELSHTNAGPVTFTVEVDFLGDNTWSEYARFSVPGGTVYRHEFPTGYNAHWARLKSDAATRATAVFTYDATPAGNAFVNWAAAAGLSVTNSTEELAASDPDGDGASTLMEYFSGSSPTDASSVNRMTVREPGTNGSGEWILEYRQARGATAAGAVVQTCDVLGTAWVDRPDLVPEIVVAESDVTTELRRVTIPTTNAPSGFARLRVWLLP